MKKKTTKTISKQSLPAVPPCGFFCHGFSETNQKKKFLLIHHEKGLQKCCNACPAGRRPAPVGSTQRAPGMTCVRQQRCVPSELAQGKEQKEDFWAVHSSAALNQQAVLVLVVGKERSNWSRKGKEVHPFTAITQEHVKWSFLFYILSAQHMHMLQICSQLWGKTVPSYNSLVQASYVGPSESNTSCVPVVSTEIRNSICQSKFSVTRYYFST